MYSTCIALLFCVQCCAKAQGIVGLTSELASAVLWKANKMRMSSVCHITTFPQQILARFHPYYWCCQTELEMYVSWASLVTLGCSLSNIVNVTNDKIFLDCKQKRQTTSVIYTWLSTSAHYLEAVTLFACLQDVLFLSFVSHGRSRSKHCQKQQSQLPISGKEAEKCLSATAFQGYSLLLSTLHHY